MKAAVFYGKHDIRIEERPIPKVGPEEVLIQVKACGVCGTDVHIFHGDPGAAEVPTGTILGHEFSGIIREVGPDVQGWAPGDRVCVDPNRYCGKCQFCRDGQAHLCQNMIGYGTTTDGGFAEYCAVHQSQLYALGSGTSYQQGAMAEPVACCLHGIDLCDIIPGQESVVIGGGMIGLIMLQLLKLAGASRVALLEPIAEKRDMARKLGADLCINSPQEDAAAALKSAGMGWIRTVIECVGKPSTIETALELAGPKGTVMMFGLTKPEQTVSIYPFRIFQKELTIKASYTNPYTHHRALALIDAGRLDVTSMICRTAPLEELSSILSSPELLSRGKYLITPAGADYRM